MPKRAYWPSKKKEIQYGRVNKLEGIFFLTANINYQEQLRFLLRIYYGI